MTYNPNSTKIDFKAHAAGLTLIFINMGTSPQVMHGGGSIPHGQTNMPMAPSSDGVTPGGTYIVTIAPTTNKPGTFYSHTYQDTGNVRTINFGK